MSTGSHDSVPMRPNGPCAVVVTYYPDEGAIKNLRILARECGCVLVVDNGSSMEAKAAMALEPGVTLFAQKENIGLAAALNLGLNRAVELGYDWAVTFDQDSRPEPGMVRCMWEARETMPEAVVIGPRIREEGGVADDNYRWLCRHERWPGCFRMVRSPMRGLPEVTILVTSGSMLHLATWSRLGRFDVGLFIDYIDIDYCLRVGRAGCKVAVAGGKEAVLHHRLGARRKGVFAGRDFRPMHHAPFRHYYMARNRVIVWQRHALAVPHWAVFDGCFAVYNFLRVLAFEDQRWAKVKAIVRGTWHGLLGRAGPMPP